MSEFLVELFKLPDPTVSRGESLTVREVLDRGAKRLSEELADQPELRGTMLTTLGSAYRELGLYEPRHASPLS